MLQWLWWLDRRAGRWSRGQGLVEYALIMIFVAVVLIALLVILGPGVKNFYVDIVNEL